MTTWSIQYGDETGAQVNRTTDDIGEVHATLDHFVKDAERTAGYAGQTATWRDYSGLIADGNVGNWTLDIVNLDTHTPDGYTLAEAAELQAEFYGDDLYLDRSDATWGELDADPLENRTESFTLAATTEWSVVVTLEADMPTAPVEFATRQKEAEAHARMCVAILTDSAEPYPLHPMHDSFRTVYQASGHHDVFGEWSVDLIATDV